MRVPRIKRFLIVQIRSWIFLCEVPKLKKLSMKSFLTWFHIGVLTGLIIFNHTITKLISRSSLLKRAKKYLPLLLRKLFLQYFDNVNIRILLLCVGKHYENNLMSLLRIQICRAKLILDTNIYASSVDPYNKLDWIPIDDIIELRKRFIICNIMVNVLIISIIIFATSIPDIIMELENQLIWKYPSLF